jgi:hypothetical protein
VQARVQDYDVRDTVMGHGVGPEEVPELPVPKGLQAEVVHAHVPVAIEDVGDPQSLVRRWGS